MAALEDLFPATGFGLRCSSLFASDRNAGYILVDLDETDDAVLDTSGLSQCNLYRKTAVSQTCPSKPHLLHSALRRQMN
jgi:hypothetical protein